MTVPRESWRAVAVTLGERMRYQAHNCPESNPPHVPTEAAAECPYCADTVAYQRYRRRLDQDPTP